MAKLCILPGAALGINALMLWGLGQVWGFALNLLLAQHFIYHLSRVATDPFVLVLLVCISS